MKIFLNKFLLKFSLPQIFSPHLIFVDFEEEKNRMEKIRLVEANKEVNLFDLKCIKNILCLFV